MISTQYLPCDKVHEVNQRMRSILYRIVSYLYPIIFRQTKMNPTVSIFAPLYTKRKKETLFTLRKGEIDQFVDEIFVRRPKKRFIPS